MVLGYGYKIAIGWAAVWVSGGFTFVYLQQRVDTQRKNKMRERQLKRRQQRREQKLKELEAENNLEVNTSLQ